MPGKLRQQAASNVKLFKGHLHMKHCIVLPPEVARLGNEGFVYVTSLTKGDKVFGYIVSPDGLDMIISRIELSLRTLPYLRLPEQFHWMAIAAHYGLGALSKVEVKDRKIAPPTTHLLAPPGPLWFSSHEGFALVGSDLNDFRAQEPSPEFLESAAAALGNSLKVLSSRPWAASRGP